MGQTSTEALLFDLGGVVFEIDFGRAFEYWAAHAGVPVETLRPFYGIDSWYERHERGEIDAAAYFDALRDTLGIALSDEHFAAGWNAIFLQEVPGVAELLEDLGGRIPIYAFSNSNVTHQRHWEKKYAKTLDLFEEVFVSCELGLRKPESAAFRRVSSAIGVGPEAIMFFDDTHENVDGAREVGMRAIHVRSFDDMRESVEELIR
jgi:putative hydrolase of the HAD superfamily